MDTHVFLGIHGSATCFDVTNGQELWRTRLASSKLTNIIVVKDCVVAHAKGHLYGLNKKTGSILWENKLKGLGYGECFLASSASATSQELEQFAAKIAEEKERHNS